MDITRTLLERKHERADDHIQRKTDNLHSRGGRNGLLERKKKKDY